MLEETPSAPAFAAVRHLARRRIGDQGVVLDLRNSRIFGLNPSAGELLEALQSPLTVDQIATRFAANAADAQAVPAEVARFVDELATLGLIERRAQLPGGPAGAPAAIGATPWVAPALLWQEEVARVTSQISPPQQIGNPACLP